MGKNGFQDGRWLACSLYVAGMFPICEQMDCRVRGWNGKQAELREGEKIAQRKVAISFNDLAIYINTQRMYLFIYGYEK